MRKGFDSLTPIAGSPIGYGAIRVDNFRVDEDEPQHFHACWPHFLLLLDVECWFHLLHFILESEHFKLESATASLQG